MNPRTSSASGFGVSQADYPPANALMRRLGAYDPPKGFPLFDPARIDWPGDRPCVHREALAESLAAINQQYDNRLDAATLDDVRGEGAFVIGGQQPILAGGPLLCLLKLVTVIAHAWRLEDAHDRPVIPAFWIASEDHDIAEINRLRLGKQTVVCDHAELEGAGSRPPVAALSPAPFCEPFLTELQKTLPVSRAKTAVVEAVRRADWSNYPALFATLTGQLLPEPWRVVWVDPMRMRPLLAPALKRIVEKLPAVLEAFEAGSAMLREQGFEPPLEQVNLFEFVEGRRVACGLSIERAALHDGDCTHAELAALIERQPERFSPGAALRPIVQDMVMPTLATVGGPTELLYLWQIDPMYKALGVERSKLAARIGATVIADREWRMAQRFGLSTANLFGAGAMLNDYDPLRFEVDDADLRELERLRDELTQRIGALDASGMEKMIDKARQSIAHQVDKLTERLREQRLSQQGLGKGLLKALVDRLLPGGAAQDRTEAVVELIGRFGNGWVDGLIREVDPADPAHRVLVLNDKGDAT